MNKHSVITPHFSGYRQVSIMANELTNDLQQSQGVAKIYSSGVVIPKAKVGIWYDSLVPGRKIQDSPGQPKPLNFNKLNTWLIIKSVEFFSALF